mmetsp:Transcript_65674/g.137295  ORF Transcript_65674/g.137295 Transcript_65674/m.137295 type:complete len:217 (-) Transcript_65674:248-898(-)
MGAETKQQQQQQQQQQRQNIVEESKEQQQQQDYYELLGVDRDATSHQIKNAWKKKALKCHPDKAPDHLKDEAEASFKSVTQAHEVLINPEQRRLYDLYGPELRPPTPEGGFRFGGFGGFDGFDPDDPFGADEQQEMFEALLRELLKRRQAEQEKEQEPPLEVWEGVVGFAALGSGLAFCWIFREHLGRMGGWARWQWRFLLHDFGKLLGLAGRLLL